MFKGSLVAIVTPFKDGKLDEAAFKNLLEFHVANGTHGIVACGTTGESPTLSSEEHDRVIELAVETINGRLPVIAGTGTNSTDMTLKKTRHAKKAGADGVLIVAPYYNKPTQEGLYQHYRKIAEEVDIPIIVYNVPGRTASNVLPETMARLSELKNIVGLKEATGSLQQASDTIGLCGEKITVLSGDDALTLPILAIGGKGVISVTANIAPADVAEVINEFERGNITKARELHYKLRPLHNAMFYESNPIPVKTALGLMGKCTGELRLPLAPMQAANLNRLKEVLTNYGLIQQAAMHA